MKKTLLLLLIPLLLFAGGIKISELDKLLTVNYTDSILVSITDMTAESGSRSKVIGLQTLLAFVIDSTNAISAGELPDSIKIVLDGSGNITIADSSLSRADFTTAFNSLLDSLLYKAAARDSAVAAMTDSLGTEAAFEAFAFPVFTPSDGALDDDDVTAADFVNAAPDTFLTISHDTTLAMQADISAVQDTIPVHRSRIDSNTTNISTIEGYGVETLDDGTNGEIGFAKAGGGLEFNSDFYYDGGIYNQGKLDTVVDKNITRAYLKDTNGDYLIYQPYVWGGSSWTSTHSYGFGYATLQYNTGRRSNGIGYLALRYNTGIRSNGIGGFVLYTNTGDYSNGFGYSTLMNNTGDYSNGFGYSALMYNTGSSCSGFGYATLQYNTGAYANGFGVYVLRYNTGAYVNGFGNEVLTYNEGDYNTAIGSYAFNSFTEDTGNAKEIEMVNPGDNQVTITSHGFGLVGTYVNLKISTTGTLPTGMDDGIDMWKIIHDDILECVTDEFTTVGTGTHTLTPQIIYSNSLALGYNAEPDASNQVVLGDANIEEVKTAGNLKIGGYIKLGDVSSTETGTLEYDATNGFQGYDGSAWGKLLRVFGAKVADLDSLTENAGGDSLYIGINGKVAAIAFK